LPDGTPAPVIAIFDVAQVTLTGAVPDQAAKDRLQALAIANARPGQAAAVANFLTINPTVPRGLGVRVVELTSTRFPEGSAEVRPSHGLELDRIVSVMNALPSVTVLMVGHADQRGDEVANYKLSAARAEAVAGYIIAHGIAASRVSSRAVGETDLLTLNNDEAALTLNRRTEFILYGLILP
jgi:outer membrane protein OmpA-like peptidoglycan-associated protein